MGEKKVGFNHNNLNSLKSMDFRFIDKVLLLKIVSLLEMINFSNLDIGSSYIESNDSIENEFASFCLYSSICIPIEISLHKYGIDVYVEKNQSIFEMYESNNGDDIPNILKKWLSYDIVNKIKLSDGLIVYTKFYNKADSSDILSYNISFFNLFYFNEYKLIKYQSWMS